MKSLFRNERANQMVIAGVLAVIIVGVTLGMATLTYSKLEPTFITGTYQATTDSINASSVSWLKWIGDSNVMSLSRTIGSLNGVDPYDTFTIKNSSFTAVRNTDYRVFVGNSSVSFTLGGGLDNMSSYSVTYTSARQGTTTVNTINSNTYSGLSLGAISPLVLAASLILGIVMALGTWAYTRQ